MSDDEGFKSYTVPVACRGSLLSSDERHLLSTMALRAGRDGLCWASIATLEEDSGIGERTIQRCLKRLLAIGVLVVVEAPERRTRTYRFELGAIPMGVQESPQGDSQTPRQGDTGDSQTPMGVHESPSPVCVSPSTDSQTPNPYIQSTPSSEEVDPGAPAEPAVPDAAPTPGWFPPQQPDRAFEAPETLARGAPPPSSAAPPPKRVDRYDEVASYFGAEVHRAIGRRESAGPERGSKLGQKLLRAVQQDADLVLDAMRLVAHGQGQKADWLRSYDGLTVETVLRHVDEYAELWRSQDATGPPSRASPVYHREPEPLTKRIPRPPPPRKS